MSKRPIKFRAYGHEHDDKSGGIKMFSADYGFHLSTDGGELFSCHEGDAWGSSSYVDKHPLLVLMQYTGVNDDNGVELYEDDVVDTELGHAVIGFQHGFFCLNWLDDDGSRNDANVELLGCNWKGREREKLVLVGNIHENPELVK